MTEEIKESARFKIVGRLLDNLEVQTSKAGNSYLRFAVQVASGPRLYTRKWFLIAFGEQADALGSLGAQGDTVEVLGRMEMSKNQTTERWETTLVVESGKKLAEAPQNDPAAVKAAQARADIDDIGF
jgi:hypothetical protein